MRTFNLLVASGIALSISATVAAQGLNVQAPAVTDRSLGPRTLTPNIVSCTDLPTHAVPTSPYRIVAAQSGYNHKIYAPGEIVVLNGGTPQGLMPGQRFYIRHLQLGLSAEPPSPTTPAPIRTSGFLTVVAADERFALARIDFACDAIEAGDYLDPFVEPALPTKVAADGPSNFLDMARVLFGPDRRQQFGAGDLANIDRGRSKGIGNGTRVGFFRDRQNGTPLVELGEGIVIDSAEESAKIVVTRASEVIFAGDYVTIRGTPVTPQN
jgi:hypothetical protein